MPVMHNRIPRVYRQLELQAESELHASGIVHGGHLPEGSGRRQRISARPPRRIARQVVAMIQRVEAFRQRLQAQPFGQTEGAADACTDAEEIVTRPHVSPDVIAVYDWARRGSLDRSRAGDNVHRQRGIVLQNAAPLEAMAMHRAVEDYAMPLVVVATAVVAPDIRVVD